MRSETNKILMALLLVSLFLIYSIFLYVSLPIDKREISKEVAEGKLIWQQRNCNACHQLYGLGGYLGPDLTNVYSQKGPAYIRAFLANGTAIMPDFKFNEREVNAVIGYLRNTDASGNADPRTFTINIDGTIEQAKKYCK